jgi:hypothetical protein
MGSFAMFRGLVPALLALGLLATAGPASAETYMTVGDVPVDVTAKNAAAARDQAIAAAQSIAFDRLVKRLVTNPADQARLHPSQQDIESFVQDFGVENERVSTVRYIGLYSVRFRTSRVRKYLSDAGIGAISEQQEVLVVPVYRTAAGTQLWEQGNEWRAAWDRGGLGDGPVTLIIPNGDSFDTGSLSAASAAGGDMGALGAVIGRYHAAGAVVVVAEPRDPAKGAASGLNLTLVTYDRSGPKGTQTLAVNAAPGEQAQKVWGKGVSAAVDSLESGWRQAIASGGSTGLGAGAAPQEAADTDTEPAKDVPISYPILAAVRAASDVVAIRGRLGGIPGIQRVALDALTRDNAALTIDFAGDPLALQAALAGSGYVLVQTAPATAGGPGLFQLRPLDAVSAGAPPQ